MQEVQLACPNRDTPHTIQLSGVARAATVNAGQVQKGARQYPQYDTTAAESQRNIAGSDEFRRHNQSRQSSLRVEAQGRDRDERHEI